MGEGSTYCVQFPVVGAEINQFIFGNLNSLPDAPFSLIASCRGVGITEAGDALETNDQFLQIEFF